MTVKWRRYVSGDLVSSVHADPDITIIMIPLFLQINQDLEPLPMATDPLPVHPQAWNNLPDCIRYSKALDSFKTRLKAHLF